MSVLPSVAHEEARDVELGRICVECGESFTHGHGRVVACKHCHAKLPLMAQQLVPLAIHPEASPEAFKRLAQDRKRRIAAKENE
jgi:DNA-directed RNA polymerase subunit RPC12/RpoP